MHSIGIDEMTAWLIRAICITPFLIGLAFTVKHYMIEPYGMSVLEFEIEAEKVLKKGDRE